ncbi:MAG: phosphoenolpyruvate synthase [Clostridia bacterium]|nr:phosphoenolpyruvate synthase [Clostridia bacterium]
MAQWILSFQQIGKGDVPLAGGKGANLGEMTRAEIPVPPGVVVSSEAYDAFMAENGIRPAEILQSADTQNACEEILARIRSGVFPQALEAELRAAYRAFGETVPVAVRSSATAEDLADASFAGQQETYLNVRGEDDMLERVRDCYASLWGYRAVRYRQAQGYAHAQVSLAVVLQRMIESDVSGVLFTRNPSTSANEVIVNASYGLGEAVVSGIVSPDEIVCDPSGNTLRRTLGGKEIQIVYDAQAGTRKEDVPAEKRAAFSLTDEQLRRLVALAMRIEAHYGHPMDIEWGIFNDELYILQARSITTLARETAFSEADFASLPPIQPAKGRMRENILFNLEKLPRPYYPLDHDFGDLVGAQKQVIMGEIGFSMNEMTPIDDDGISSFSVGGFRPNRNILHLLSIFRQMKDDAQNARKADEALQNCSKRLRQEQSLVPSDLQRTGEALLRMRGLIADTAYARFRYAIFPQVIENLSLTKALRKIDPALNSFDLMEGLDYVTAEINRDMVALADELRADPDTARAVLTQPYAQLIRTNPALRTRFEAFLEKYGHRSDFNCYCFTAKSWNDDPDRFLGTLCTMLRSPQGKILGREESAKKYQALLRRAQDTFSAKQFAHFEKKAEAVRHDHYIREATQYLWECEFSHCRVLLRRCAEQLNERYEDLLYLFANELFTTCAQGKLSETLREKLARRKAKRPLAEAYWTRCIEGALATEGDEISGVSGSAGQATGKVRVVRGPAEFDKLQQGEILVCTYTDPEWTPLFTLAAGVVVDTGGTLSHAAIVAREYGIPAVLATGNATRLLKDGDRVVVDGTNARVKKL